MPVLRTRRFVRVKLDMVTRCQLRCIMCHFAHPEFRENPDQMGRELLEKIAAELFPISHDVVLSSSAEPLLARELPRALELCRKHQVPSFHFSTNAIGLTRDVLNTIVDVQMPVLTVSIDGGTKDTFEAIRPPMRWEKLMGKLDLVREVKRERGSRVPAVGVTSVLMCRTIREMPELVRVCAAKGVEHLSLVHMGVIGGLGVERESLINEPELSNRMLEETRVVAAANGISVTAPFPFPTGFGKPAENGGAITDAARADETGHGALGDAGEAVAVGSPSVAEFMNHKNREFAFATRDKDFHNRRCYFPWYYIHVNPDGTVFPCGCWYEFSTFGDFKTQSFREIWTGAKYRELRRQILSMKLRDVCANCSVANMGRPDVLSSFSQRAKIKREWREKAAASGTAGGPGTH